MMKLKNVAALIALGVISVGVLMGANTQNKLGPSYFSGRYHTANSGADTVWTFRKTEAGAFPNVGAISAVNISKLAKPRWWTFSATGDTQLHVYTPSRPGFNGDYTDTSSTNYQLIHLNDGEAWNSEGMVIYAYKFRIGTTLMAMARN